MKTLAKRLEEKINTKASEKAYKEMGGIRHSISLLKLNNKTQIFEFKGEKITLNSIVEDFHNRLRVILTARNISIANQNALKNLMLLTDEPQKKEAGIINVKLKNGLDCEHIEAIAKQLNEIFGNQDK